VARAVLGSVAYGVVDRATGPAAVTHTHDMHVSLSGPFATIENSSENDHDHCGR
jgi:hypothetical protein